MDYGRGTAPDGLPIFSTTQARHISLSGVSDSLSGIGSVNYKTLWEDGPNKFGYKTCLKHWIERQEKSAKANFQFYGNDSLFGLSIKQFNTEMFIFNNMSQGEKNRHLQGFTILM